jgi:hypothetical protein
MYKALFLETLQNINKRTYQFSVYYCEIFFSQGWEFMAEHFSYVHFIFFIPFRKSLIFLKMLKITNKRYIMG